MTLATFGTLAGKGVVITGAAAGIGRAAALYLAGEGVRVVVSDIDADAGKASWRRSAPPGASRSSWRATSLLSRRSRN
jgi:NAD(P)-dependent dehydrogenase (short-subunit alcohol dehydrogenase family)